MERLSFHLSFQGSELSLNRMDQQRFWKYYDASLAWKDRLLAGEQVVNDRLSIGGAMSSESSRDQMVGQSFDQWSGQIRAVQSKTSTDPIGDQMTNQTEELDSTSECDESVSEEFLAFIAQTRKHQMEREKRRQELAHKEQDEVEYKDLSELENRTKLIASRAPELREDLYGEQANEIYSKELKLQFAFNEFCDKHQPKFWPMIPINLSIKQ